MRLRLSDGQRVVFGGDGSKTGVIKVWKTQLHDWCILLSNDLIFPHEECVGSGVHGFSDSEIKLYRVFVTNAGKELGLAYSVVLGELNTSRLEFEFKLWSIASADPFWNMVEGVLPVLNSAGEAHFDHYDPNRYL